MGRRWCGEGICGRDQMMQEQGKEVTGLGERRETQGMPSLTPDGHLRQDGILGVYGSDSG